MGRQDWADFGQFSNSSCVSPFKPEFGIPPTDRDSFNDLLLMGSYQEAGLSVADRQRRRAHSLLTDAPSFQARAESAARQVFPLPMDTPIPPPHRRAASLVRASSPLELSLSRDEQLARLGSLISETIESNAVRNSSILHNLKPSAVELQTIALKQLFAPSGIGGSEWVGQFAVGFPFVSALPKREFTWAIRQFAPRSHLARYSILRLFAFGGGQRILNLRTRPSFGRKLWGGSKSDGWDAPPILRRTVGRVVSNVIFLTSLSASLPRKRISFGPVAIGVAAWIMKLVHD